MSKMKDAQLKKSPDSEQALADENDQAKVLGMASKSSAIELICQVAKTTDGAGSGTTMAVEMLAGIDP